MGTKDSNFSIRHSSQKDVGRIMEIYEYARKFMAENGNPRQWGMTGWPPEKLIRQDIEAQHSYVCEADGRIVGTFYYNYGPHIEPSYERICGGAWTGVKKYGESGNTYGVVHRIAGDGSVKGIGTFCLVWAFEQCHHLRIDTHPDNRVMQKLLQKQGFERCGYIYVMEDRDPRIAFEKTGA